MGSFKKKTPHPEREGAFRRLFRFRAGGPTSGSLGVAKPLAQDKLMGNRASGGAGRDRQAEAAVASIVVNRRVADAEAGGRMRAAAAASGKELAVGAVAVAEVDVLSPVTTAIDRPRRLIPCASVMAFMPDRPMFAKERCET